MTQTRPTLPAARVGGPGEVLTDERVRAFVLIGAGGYVGGVAAQSQSALNAIRFASGFAPAIFILIGIAIFFRYPLTEQTFATMVAETAARRAERAAGTHPTPE